MCMRVYMDDLAIDQRVYVINYRIKNLPNYSNRSYHRRIESNFIILDGCFFLNTSANDYFHHMNKCQY